ncbi:MAG: phosphodiester glycosidase family protein [Faecousia sp.]
MAENAFLSRLFRWLPGIVSGALAVSVLLGAVRWIGVPARSTEGEDTGETLDLYLTDALSDAMELVRGADRVYRIGRHALAAPEPDPACFGQTEDPGTLDFSAAEKLLDGQKLYFSPAVTLAPGTPVRYYLDDTILAITWKQVLDGGVYTFSEVKIAHPSQFRRFLSGGEFGSDKLYVTTEMAQSVNAVVASSGDFYGYRQAGTLVYDGVVRRVNNGLVDTCYIDKNGDLLFTTRYDQMDKEQSQQFVDEHEILFSLAFGPVLIQDGQVITPDSYAVGEINDHYPRSALCQLGKLHYLLAVVNGEDAQPEVPTIHRFAENLLESGITKAYALDGGQTAVIAMDGQLINAVLYGHQRKISDIIYFATAIPGKEREEKET